MSEFVAHWPVRVYWEDTDAGGIVYHANYLRFMERARSELLESLNISQLDQLNQQNGILFVVASLTLNFRRGAQLGDNLVIKTRVLKLRRASIVFEQTIWRNDELMTSAEIRVGAISAKTKIPSAIPELLYNKFSSLLVQTAQAS